MTITENPGVQQAQNRPAVESGRGDGARADGLDVNTPGAKREAGGGTPRVVRETGGPAGPEPTRYGDWERNGRCIDF